MDIREYGAHHIAGADGTGEDIEGAGNDFDLDVLVAEFFEDGLDFLAGRPFHSDDDQLNIVPIDGLFNMSSDSQPRELFGEAIVGLTGIADVACVVITGGTQAIFRTLVDTGSDFITAYQQGIENDFSFDDLVTDLIEDDHSAGDGECGVGEEKDEIRLIEVMIVFDGIVDDDGEEDDRAADDTIDESIGQFGQPGFLIQGFIGPHQGIEDKPTEGDGRCTQPEAGSQQ